MRKKPLFITIMLVALSLYIGNTLVEAKTTRERDKEFYNMPYEEKIETIPLIEDKNNPLLYGEIDEENNKFYFLRETNDGGIIKDNIPTTNFKKYDTNGNKPRIEKHIFYKALLDKDGNIITYIEESNYNEYITKYYYHEYVVYEIYLPENAIIKNYPY